MQKWEYMYINAYKNNVIKVNGKPHPAAGQVTDPLPEFLNQHGNEGWELVNSFLGDPSKSGDMSTWTLVFKRPAG